jgi:hypothetical protein
MPDFPAPDSPRATRTEAVPARAVSSNRSRAPTLGAAGCEAASASSARRDTDESHSEGNSRRRVSTQIPSNRPADTCAARFARSSAARSAAEATSLWAEADRASASRHWLTCRSSRATAAMWYELCAGRLAAVISPVAFATPLRILSASPSTPSPGRCRLVAAAMLKVGMSSPGGGRGGTSVSAGR